MDWSTSKVLRIERGDVGVSKNDLKALLDYYGITAPEVVEDFVQMAQLSRRAGWEKYRGVHSPEFFRYLSMESSASYIRQYEPMVIPGLLQTEDYARAVLRQFVGEDDQNDLVERRVQVRLERQELMDHRDRPVMSFVVDEGVLLRVVGGYKVWRAQLEHLKTLAKTDLTEIRVVRFEAGEYLGMQGPFVLLEFTDADDDDLLYLEDQRGGPLQSFEDPHDTDPYLVRFEGIQGQATDPKQFAGVIDDIIGQMDERLRLAAEQEATSKVVRPGGDTPQREPSRARRAAVDS